LFILLNHIIPFATLVVLFIIDKCKQRGQQFFVLRQVKPFFWLILLVSPLISTVIVCVYLKKRLKYRESQNRNQWEVSQDGKIQAPSDRLNGLTSKKQALPLQIAEPKAQKSQVEAPIPATPSEKGIGDFLNDLGGENPTRTLRRRRTRILLPTLPSIAVGQDLLMTCQHVPNLG
jgi:hypothetical protein